MSSTVAAPATVAVAYSGGRDSTALLHATVRVAREQGYQVVALHVHHGLQPAADEWLSRCEETCRRWRQRGWPISFAHERLSLNLAPGQSVEAEARRARYEALARMAKAHGASVVMLAHHRGDQAETFLLQALRGAGVAGLAAMPREVDREGVRWLRPWLDRPRAQIEAYVRLHGLSYIDDTSNADPRYARNRLRLNAWPALAASFPQAEQGLARAAAWCAEAAECAQALAALDLQAVSRAEGLSRSALVALGPARARNALRAWYRQATGVPLPAQALDRLWHESGEGVSARVWTLPAAVVRLYRDRWSLEPLHDGASPAASATGRATEPAAGLPQQVALAAHGSADLPQWGARLSVSTPRNEGDRALSVPRELLETVELRPRQGGETFQLGPGRPPRSLKKQYQAAGVPAWARRAPLVYASDLLVFVPGLGVDARAAALPGADRLCIAWEPFEQD